MIITIELTTNEYQRIYSSLNRNLVAWNNNWGKRLKHGHFPKNPQDESK